MNNWELFIVTFFEISSFMLIFSIFNKNQEKLFLKNFIIALLTSIFVFLSNIFFINVGNFLNYIIMFILIVAIYKNKLNLYETTLEFCITLIALILLELLFTTILKLVSGINTIYTFNNGIMIDSLMLGVSFNIYCKLPIYCKYKLCKAIFEQLTFKMVILNSIIYIICFKLLWEYNKNLVLNYIVIFTLIFLSSNVANFILANQLVKLTNERRSLELSSMYSYFIEEMISEIKRKQHEFKNHLNAICGICYTTDEKFIKESIINYFKSIGSSMEEIDKLINIDNKILAAVIYSKVCEARSKNIKFLYSIKSKLDNTKLKEYEIVEILSNLLNNAFEYIESKDINEKVVYVEIGSERNINFIEVSNYYVPIDTIDISLIFKKGFSKKGKNRGYGLYNVKKIVENNGGKLQVFFNNEYITFKILF